MVVDTVLIMPMVRLVVLVVAVVVILGQEKRVHPETKEVELDIMDMAVMVVMAAQSTVVAAPAGVLVATVLVV
jgi:hypothetical protein